MASSIWPKSRKARVDRSLSAHSVMGLVISAVMFIVCLSGTVAVFEDEIGWWEKPVSEPVQAVSAELAQATAESVVAAQPGTTHLYLYLPRENWPRYVAGGDDGLQTANTTGTLTGEYETPWNDFLIHLHYYLNLPASFGMIIVAIFGVMLVAMTVSGFLAHPRIFRDAFRLRRTGQARLVFGPFEPGFVDEWGDHAQAFTTSANRVSMVLASAASSVEVIKTSTSAPSFCMRSRF